MKFPHAIEILRATGEDAYGNPSSSFTTVTRTLVSAFIVQRSAMSGGEQVLIHLALLPPATDIRTSDRVAHDGRVFDVIGDIVTASSPSKAVLKTATLREVSGGA